MDELDVGECWQLLATEEIGRVAVVVGHYPLVFPVNYVVDGRRILFRTGVGTKLWSVSRSNITFEVDSVDRRTKTGWSVMVRGAAHEVAETGRPPDVTPWAPGDKDHLLRVVADQVSGRRIRRSPATRGTPTTTGLSHD